MTPETIRSKIIDVIKAYEITRVILFGSRAEGTENDSSDVDLIVEFDHGVSLLVLSKLKCDLEDVLGLSVDVIHGPIEPTDMLEIGKTVKLYAS